MPRPDERSYDASILDVQKLKAFAQRVSRETRRAPMQAIVDVVMREETYYEEEFYGFLGKRKRHITKTRSVPHKSEEIVPGHWVLHRTYHNLNTRDEFVLEENHDEHLWLLSQTGQLLKYVPFVLDRTFLGKYSGSEQKTGRSLSNMSEQDILRLDYADKYQEFRPDKRTSGNGNWQAGSLNRHAKGVGLSLA